MMIRFLVLFKQNIVVKLVHVRKRRRSTMGSASFHFNNCTSFQRPQQFLYSWNLFTNVTLIFIQICSDNSDEDEEFASIMAKHIQIHSGTPASAIKQLTEEIDEATGWSYFKSYGYSVSYLIYFFVPVISQSIRHQKN